MKKLYKLRILSEGEFDKLNSSDVERLKLLTLNNKLTTKIGVLQDEVNSIEAVSRVQVSVDLGDPAPEEEDSCQSSGRACRGVGARVGCGSRRLACPDKPCRH